MGIYRVDLKRMKGGKFIADVDSSSKQQVTKRELMGFLTGATRQLRRTKNPKIKDRG